MATRIRIYRLMAGAMGIFLLLLLGWIDHASAEVSNPKVRTTVSPLDLSTSPPTEEIMAAGQLGGPLYSTHEVQDQSEAKKMNLSFAVAIQTWNQHDYKLAIELFRKHIEEYPESPWVAEAILHIGCDAQYNGRYSQAEAIFRWILDAYKGSDHIGAKMLVNKARLRLGNQMVLQYNFDEATKHFRDLQQEGLDWRDRTYAAHWIQRLSRYKQYDWAMLNCGVKALAHVMQKEGKEVEAREVMQIQPDSLKGQSFKDLKSIASRYGYNLTAHRIPVEGLKDVPLPAVVQLDGRNKGDSGHYWVLEEVKDEVLKLFDPQSSRTFQQTPKEFSKEWGGNVLLFSDKENLPGTRLAEEEMGRIYGGCCGVPAPESDLGDRMKWREADYEMGFPQGRRAAESGRFEVEHPHPRGAPKWSVNPINMNLFMKDIPLWYENPIGPSVQIQLSYNSQSAINQHEPFGNKWQFNYGSYLVVDTVGIVTVFMPDGRRDVFTPDGAGGYSRPYQVFNTLTKISENHFELRSPFDTVYVYNIPSGTPSQQPFLVEIRDPYGQKLSFGYDSSVELKTITDALGRVTTLTYNSNGLVTQATDPFGRMATFQYDANRNLIKLTDMGGYWSSLTYDQNVYITSIEDAKGKWNFYIEPADGINNDSIAYPSPGGTMWANYRVTVTDPLGGKEEYYYNGYSGYSWYVSPRDYIGYTSDVNNLTSAPKTQYTLGITSGERGEIKAIESPEQRRIYYGYDEEGNLLTVDEGGGRITSYTYNDMGQITSITDAEGNVTTMTYASNGVDLQSLQDGLGTMAFGVNNTHDITSITDFLNNTMTLTYNNYGQMSSKTNALGIITNYIYDSSHQFQRMEKDSKVLESFTHDGIGRVKTYTDATGLTLTYDYNNLDKITKITYPDGRFESFTYSNCCPNLLESMRDRAGRTTSYTYDVLKRLSQTTNPEGGVTGYAYDANGNMIELVDPNNNVTSFKYDFDNWLIQKTYADGKSLQYGYVYNPKRLLSFSTGGRTTTEYGYDARDNLTNISYSDDTPQVYYEYDNYNRLVRMDTEQDTYRYGYDANSSLMSIDGPLSADTLTFEYDALGRRTKTSVEGGQNITYRYDTLNRLTSIQLGSNIYSYSYTNASPLPQTLTRPNGSVTRYQYDALNRLTEISNETSSGAIINKYVYTYDAQDYRSTEAVTNGSPLTLENGSTTYSYSNSNELLSSTNPSRTLTYDADGNMTQGYTPEGNAFTASYDAENRLKAIEYTDSGSVLHRTEYNYRGDSLLANIKKYENDTLVETTQYIRDGLLVLQERDSSNNTLNEYAWGLDLGGGIGGLLHLNQGGHNYSYLYDGKGNVTALIDGSQSVVSTYTYDPFGNLTSRTGSLDQPFKFSTKPYYEDTGLSYYGYRFYLPAIGRWMTKDPLGETGGINLYGFVGNNPINWIDPLGKEMGGKLGKAGNANPPSSGDKN